MANSRRSDRRMMPTPRSLVTLQHTVDQIPQRAPEVLATGKTMLINEEHIVLEAGVQMRLETQLDDDWVVVAVDVGVDAV